MIGEKKVVVRGGGDIATGAVQKLWRAGFRVAVFERETPTTIRRSVAVSSALLAGEVQVEDLRARRIENWQACEACWAEDIIPVLADPDCASLPPLQASFLVDAILAKRNLGTRSHMAPVTIALGPGFTAPEDVDAVIETMRGHDLGRLITAGAALPNSGVPGKLGGEDRRRVLYAPVGGVVAHHKNIGDRVQAGDLLFSIDDTTVFSPLEGTLRGLIAPGIAVEAGLKCADVDPRPEREVDWRSISDKARCIGGAVLEACLFLGRKKIGLAI